MELEIQKYLRSGRKAQDGILAFNTKKLEELSGEPYYLKIKRHNRFPNLIHFHYDTIESPKDDPIILECRGLILDESNNWNVVAFPFMRFFNEGEFYARRIDWKTARVYEKVDGTLIIMYFYNNKWRIATNGSPDASGPVGDFPWCENGLKVPLTFRRLFWHSAEYWMKGLSKSGEFDKECTYMWELTSPYNRVICDYRIDGFGKGNYLVDLTGYAQQDGVYGFDVEEKTTQGNNKPIYNAHYPCPDGSRITLIGIRDNNTFEEHDIKYSDAHYKAKSFPLGNLQEVIDAASKLNPLKQEGFVVVDSNWNRVKIKSPAYVAIHHLREGKPRKRLMKIIQNGENDEILSYKILDEWPVEKAMYEEMLAKVEILILTTEQFYATICQYAEQKEFALEAVKHPMNSAMFALRKGKAKSIRQFILSLPTDRLIDLIDKL